MLTSSKKNETAVHGCNPTISVLVVLVINTIVCHFKLEMTSSTSIVVTGDTKKLLHCEVVKNSTSLIKYVKCKMPLF